MYRAFSDAASDPEKGRVLMTTLAGIGRQQAGSPAGGAGGSNPAAAATPPAGGEGPPAAGAAGGPASQIVDMTRTMPPEVARIFGPVVRNAASVAAGTIGKELTDAWHTQVFPLCEAAFKRYPFVQGSADDVPVDDFIKLLGPGGEIERFFNTYLKSYVDTTQRPWRWAAPDKVPSGISAASLVQFDRAAQIREGLFNNGSAVQVRFLLTPVSLDPAVGQVSVDIGSQSMSYAHGPLQGQQFTWPGADGKYGVRLTMTPAVAGSSATTVEKDGPWALLRLLEGRIAGSGQADKFRVNFQGGGGSAVFELAASSVRNPFTLTALRSFRCPAKL